MTSGNGLTVAYTSYNKTATITRGTTSISFEHDTEHQRFSQMGPSGTTLYLAGAGVFAERFAGLGGGGVQWTNYLIVGGRLVGVFIQKADETTSTRYFHTDHLGSISVITKENGDVVERLSFDAWGKRRHPDGSPDPAGAITSESNRGFTGHEQLDSVGLIHMNGRVYDPLLARFGTPDPMTENPFSTQGWNRYSYVGNSPVNFTDPSGYCFMGCFWQPVFRAIGQFFQRYWGTILQFAASAICTATPGCAPFLPFINGAVSAFVAGVTSGDLGVALKAGFISAVTTYISQNIQNALGGSTSGTGAAGAPIGDARAAFYAEYGPPMYQTQLPGIYVKGATLETPPLLDPGIACASCPAANPFNDLFPATLNLIPGWYFSGFALEQFRAGNYGPAALYTGAMILDGALTFAGPVAIGARTGAAGLLTASPHRHHPIPRFLGGDDIQLLYPLDPRVHTEFHVLLKQNLAEAGFPRELLYRADAAEWARYLNIHVGSQGLAFDAVLDTARFIDRAYGTTITQHTWRNLMYNRFTPIPKLNGP